MDPILGIKQSISGRTWNKRLLDNNGNERLVYAIIQRHNLPEIIARTIVARGVALDDIEAYLTPKLRHEIPDPLKIKDMDVAVRRIINAVTSNETIGIFADYDVDGATSSALLKIFLDSIGIKNCLYIPDRMTEGYGPNEKGLRKLWKQGANLVLTLDCGILAHDVIDKMVQEGLDVIVVDHHMAEPQLPNASAIVNPNRLDDESNLGNLAAVGVTFLLLVAVTRELRERGWFKTVNEPDLLEWLDLVALGTVCDVVDLKGLNRAFVAQGLRVLSRQKNVGLKALRTSARVDSKPDAYQLGFILGPRINAAGRVGRSDLGARLLSTNDPSLADELALILENQNEDRKNLESDVLEQAILEVQQSNSEDPVLLVAGNEWHPGVIGIVAARLREKFDKPACVVSLKEGVGKGSGRSIPGWHLGSAIITGVQMGLLLSGGGHGMAAGFSIKESNLAEFRNVLNNHFRNENEGLEQQSILKVDGILSASSANHDLLTLLNQLEPYGAGNPEPLFVIPRLRIKYSSVVGEQHIKCSLIGADSTTIEGIAFRAVDRKIGTELLKRDGLPLHVLGKVRGNNWQGRTKVQLVIEDLARAD